MRKASKCLCTRSVIKRVSVYFLLLDRLNNAPDSVVYTLYFPLSFMFANIIFFVPTVPLIEPISSFISLVEFISVFA